MLFINTSKIKESTVGSSFTVTYSANLDPESLEELKALHSTYSIVNMSEFTIKPKTDPQIKCPKCGRSDYIRSFEDWGIDGGIYKYKCINCNTYIKDEPQTERSE